MSWDGIRSCGSDAEQCCKCGSVTVQVQDEPRNGCGWGSCLGGHAINCASSHPLGDFFGARSCGAPFSGMNMDTNWSKSASATTHPPRTARAGCGVIQLTTNWHAFPVQPPLSDTEIEKKHHRYTVFGSIFTFSHKIRGTNQNTRYAKKKQGMMGFGNSLLKPKP